MKSIFAKWFFSKAIDEDKASTRFVKNYFEKSVPFRKWAKDMATVDEQLKASVSEANYKPSPELHQRTMDALHENAFTKDEVSYSHFFLSKPFAAFAFSAILLICAIVFTNINKQPPADQNSWQISILKPAQLKDQSRALMVSYMDEPLLREGQALIEETQRAGERLWERFPLKPQIIPASYTPEED